MSQTSPITGDFARAAWKSRLIGWGLLAVGIAVRIRVYLGNRSLERDEAALAYNIIHRGFFAIFKQLDNDQAAPIGFLLVQRRVVHFAGSGEKALRFFPLIASIIALILFWRLCRAILTPRRGSSPWRSSRLSAKQYFYASQTKQYSTDVLVAVAMLLVTLPVDLAPHEQPLIFIIANRNSIRGGRLAVWFSHPAIFVLAAIGMVGAWECFLSSPRHTRELSIIFGAWVLSFRHQLYFRAASFEPPSVHAGVLVGGRGVCAVSEIRGGVHLVQENILRCVRGPACPGVFRIGGVTGLHIGTHHLVARRPGAFSRSLCCRFYLPWPHLYCINFHSRAA